MKLHRLACVLVAPILLTGLVPACDSGSEDAPSAAGGTPSSGGSGGMAAGGVVASGGKAATAGEAGTAGKATAGGGGTGSGGKGSAGDGTSGGGKGSGSGGAAGAAGAGDDSSGNAGSGDGGSDSGGAGKGGGGASGGGGTPGSGGTAGGRDVFGITQLYPSADPAAEWTSKHWTGDAYEIDGRTDPNDPSEQSGMRGDGTLEVTGTGELVMSGSQPRIYIYPEDAAPWQNQEITVYYQRVEDSDTAYAGLVVGARSGDGHNDDTACDAHTYYARVRNDGAFDFEKELEHPASSTQSRVQPNDAWPDGEVPRNTWIGWKFVIYNQGSNVKLEAYRDLTNGENGGDWELVNETVDDGGWFVESNCSEHSASGGESDMIVLDGGITFIRNTDVEEARYRWVSVREIEAP